MKRALLLALPLLFAAEILRVYLIMPFPGSQRMNSLELAYALHQFIWPLRVVLFAATLVGVMALSKRWARGLAIFGVLAWVGLATFIHLKLMAEKMFLQPTQVVMESAEKNVVALDRLVLGIERNGDARAYPVEIIGYHHQVQDELAGAPVLITYCTVCRTGRVYEPIVDGKHEHFRLVGMDHFNAMFEDETTKSWWRQASGRAVAGPKTDTMLPTVDSEQLTLRAWLERFPKSLILQPEATFQEEYDSLRGFDDGTRKGALTGRNAESWQDKSWVVGLVAGGRARAYDWSELQQAQTINDELGGVPVVLWLSPDAKSFVARERRLDGQLLSFTRGADTKTITDAETGSTWSEDGRCTAGALEGQRLARVESHQEFWHSWREFHPGTEQWHR